jgi:acetoin utilization deacetylase AcuC-like enzyme
VLFVSSHRAHFYPGTGDVHETGRGEGAGYTINLPLPPGLDDATFVHLYREILPPVAATFEPDLVLVSAGFDAHRDDPLGGMRMTADGFAAICGLVRQVADQHAPGRLALILEGGYDLDALAGSMHACAAVVAGAAAPEVGSPAEEARNLVDELRRHHARWWPSLAE